MEMFKRKVFVLAKEIKLIRNNFFSSHSSDLSSKTSWVEQLNLTNHCKRSGNPLKTLLG